MPQANTRPALNLLDALRAATSSDDLDEACRTIQHTLGVTDGGVAGVYFSDLDARQDTDEPSWADLDVQERHARLIAYIKSELNYMAQPNEAQQLTLPGFAPAPMGGGCVALSKELPDGSYWVVTGEDGTSIPSEGENILIGHYRADGQTVIHEEDSTWDEFDEEAFLRRVNEAVKVAPVYDRDGMVDENERRAFVEEQEQSDEAAFREFQSTRKEMDSYAFGRLVGDAMWEDYPTEQFLVYEDSFWIGTLDDGRHHLEIGNRQWATGPDTTLEDLERELFEFSKTA